MFWRFNHSVDKVYTKFMIWFVKRIPKSIRYFVLINEGARYSCIVDPSIEPSNIKYFDLVDNVA